MIDQTQKTIFIITALAMAGVTALFIISGDIVTAFFAAMALVGLLAASYAGEKWGEANKDWGLTIEAWRETIIKLGQAQKEITRLKSERKKE